MILPQSHSKEWIMRVREKTPRMDPILIEKMIMALMLVENLSINELDFIFKGGTSLALILGSLQRFSIDVDIIISDDQRVEACFDKVTESGPFLRYEENKRKSDVPKRHFKFIYDSVIVEKENHVLLDILFEENLYPQLAHIEINSPILSLGGETTFATCPTKECLLGDKLTAFAPHTTGILYGSEKQLEIIKQLFDISILFDAVDNLDMVTKTHAAIAIRELNYRGMTHYSTSDVLMDTFNTGMLIGIRGYRGDTDEYAELNDGIKRIGAFIYSGNFTIDKAVLCASKATHLSAHLMSKETGFKRFEPNMDIVKWQIQKPEYQKINRLKKTNPEAFYYFYIALEKVGLLT
jgi:hypothetical protein